MTASQPNLVELAKHGDARAIAALMNTALQPEGITIRAGFASDCLMVLAESQTVPEKAGLVEFIRHVLVDLSPEKAKKVVVQGRVVGKPTPVWHEMFDLAPAPVEPEQPEDVLPPPLAVPSVNEPIVNEQTGNDENEPEASITPMPSHPQAPQVVKLQRKRKPLLVAGASLIGLALCLVIGKQALEQTTSVSNALPVPTQQTLTPDAIAAPPAPSHDTASSPKTAATETASSTPQAATKSQKLQETTIAAAIEPNITPNNSGEAVSQSGKVSPAVSYQAIAKTATPALALKSPQMPAASKAGPAVCNSSTALNKTIFQKCLSHGMTYSQADKVIGLEGRKLSTVGSIATYQWQNGNHKVIATFHHDRLISKSQIGLK